jgi:hypothetical protein
MLSLFLDNENLGDTRRKSVINSPRQDVLTNTEKGLPSSNEVEHIEVQGIIIFTLRG